MSWIKRIKGELCEYDVKISEPECYRRGIFRVKVCTAKMVWWYPRFEIMSFAADGNPVEIAKQQIAKYEEEERDYLEIINELNGDKEGQDEIPQP